LVRAPRSTSGSYVQLEQLQQRLGCGERFDLRGLWVRRDQLPELSQHVLPRAVEVGNDDAGAQRTNPRMRKCASTLSGDMANALATCSTLGSRPVCASCRSAYAMMLAVRGVAPGAPR